MGKVEENKEKKKESLLDSAFQLFTKNGFSKTSVSDIARSAGVAKGTFYLYFTDKFDLRNRIIAHQADRLFMEAYRALMKADIADLEDQIIFLVDYILNRLSRNHQLAEFLSRHLSWGIFVNHLVGESERQQTDSYRAVMRLIQFSGKTFRNPEITIYMIIEFVSGASYNAILYQQPTDLDTLKPMIFDITRDIIREGQISSSEEAANAKPNRSNEAFPANAESGVGTLLPASLSVKSSLCPEGKNHDAADSSGIGGERRCS